MKIKSSIYLILAILSLNSCVEKHEWSLLEENGRDIRRWFGRWNLEGTEVNLAPIGSINNMIEVQEWPSRNRIGVMIWDSDNLEMNVSGSFFKDGLYDVTRLDTWNNPQTGWGGFIQLEGDSISYEFIR